MEKLVKKTVNILIPEDQEEVFDKLMSEYEKFYFENFSEQLHYRSLLKTKTITLELKSSKNFI